MTQTKLSARAWGALLLLALIWGGSFLAIRTALDEIGPITSVFYRTAIAAALLWIVLCVKGDPMPKSPALWVGFAGMGLLNNVIPFSLMAWGQLYIDTGLTSILNATTAIFGVLVAALFFADEQLTLRKALGVIVGFCGVIIAVGPQNLIILNVKSTPQLAVIAGTLSYAIAGAWARLRFKGVSALHASTGMLTCSSAMMIPIMLWSEGPPGLFLSATTWGGILYFAIVATALAYLLYYKILALAGSGNLLLVTLLIPPIAITLGAALRGETLQATAYLGFAVLALGLAILDPRIKIPKRRI